MALISPETFGENGGILAAREKSRSNPGRQRVSAKAPSNRASWTLLIVMLAFGPLAFGAVEYWSAAAMEVLAVLLGFTWIAGSVKRESLRLRLNSLTLAAAGLLLWVAIELAAGRTLDREATSQSLILLICYFLVFLVVLNENWSARWLERLASAISIIGFVIAVFAIIQLFSWNGKVYWVRDVGMGTIPYGPYVNHNHFAGLMEMTLPVSLSVALSASKDLAWRGLYLFFAVVMAVANLLSLSRGGILSMFVAVVVLLILYSLHRSVRPALFAAAGLVLLAVAWLAYLGSEPVFQRLLTLENLGREPSLAMRLWVARDTLTMIHTHPFLGTGLGTFDLAIPAYLSFYTQSRWDKAHNDYLQLLSEVGLVGFSFAIWWIVGLFRSVFRMMTASRHKFSTLRLGAFCGCLALLIHSLSDFNLQVPANAVYFAVLAALAVRPDLHDARSAGRRRQES